MSHAWPTRIPCILGLGSWHGDAHVIQGGTIRVLSHTEIIRKLNFFHEVGKPETYDSVATFNIFISSMDEASPPQGERRQLKEKLILEMRERQNNETKTIGILRSSHNCNKPTSQCYDNDFSSYR